LLYQSKIDVAIDGREEDVAALVSSLRHVMRTLGHNYTGKSRHTEVVTFRGQSSPENPRNARLSLFSPPGFMSAVPVFRVEWSMANLPERLKELRTARKLTQVRVAELLDVSPRVYNRWESGAATPYFDTLVKIADVLGVTLDELAGRKNVGGEGQIHNPELHRLYKKVDQLSDEDQKALVVVLDSLVKRSRVRRVMTE
jgi:transcriptional regulator with XRE-family HTH domain